MEKSTVLALLSLFTLLAGMAVASWELYVAERDKKGGPAGSPGQDPRQS